jgi:hypothetical protein
MMAQAFHLEGNIMLYLNSFNLLREVDGSWSDLWSPRTP